MENQESAIKKIAYYYQDNLKPTFLFICKATGVIIFWYMASSYLATPLSKWLDMSKIEAFSGVFGMLFFAIIYINHWSEKITSEDK